MTGGLLIEEVMFYMTNKEKIYNFIIEKSKEFNLQDFLINRKGGVTTEEIAQLLKIARPNVSFILNHLVREGKIVKIISKPVYYIEKNRLAHFLGNKVKEEILLKDLIDFLDLGKEKECAFENIIGHDGSLKGQIEQAKAAVLYPPRIINFKDNKFVSLLKNLIKCIYNWKSLIFSSCLKSYLLP